MPRAESHTRAKREHSLVWGLVVVAVFGALASFKPISKFIAVDRCLDSGGRWNYEAEACER